jgi:hypothetical protein
MSWSEVFTAVTMKNGVFWDVMPCGSCKNRGFGGTSRLLHQGDKNRWTMNVVVTSNRRTLWNKMGGGGAIGPGTSNVLITVIYKNVQHFTWFISGLQVQGAPFTATISIHVPNVGAQVVSMLGYCQRWEFIWNTPLRSTAYIYRFFLMVQILCLATPSTMSCHETKHTHLMTMSSSVSLQTLSKYGGFWLSQQWLWRVLYSEVLHRVALVRTDVSEELSKTCVGCWLWLTLFLVHRFLSPWWRRR